MTRQKNLFKLSGVVNHVLAAYASQILLLGYAKWNTV